MDLFLSFLTYSFLGWVCETVYCSIGNGQFINRGFLNGPFCPIYGFGALAVIWFLRLVENSILLVFILGLFVTSLLEYVTGYLLEFLFHTKYWDYSKRKFNLQGRVCLRNSLMFGGLSVIAMKVVNPTVEELIQKLPQQGEIAVTCIMGIYFVSDLMITVHTILELNGKLAEIQSLLDEVKERTLQRGQEMGQRLQEKMEFSKQELQEKLEQAKLELQELADSSRIEWEQSRMERREKLMQTIEDLQAKLESMSFLNGEAQSRKEKSEENEAVLENLRKRISDLSRHNQVLSRRLIRAFPDMKSSRFEKSLEWVKEEVLNGRPSHPSSSKAKKRNKK